MDIDELKYQILMDANQGDLLPTALLSKYDITLEKLMDLLKSLLSGGCLTLTDGKWLRITERGRLDIEEREEQKKEEHNFWKANYLNDFFDRSNTIEVNEPYLPSLDALKKIMEGEQQKETSNKK